jgi:hypothetical protein
LQH